MARVKPEQIEYAELLLRSVIAPGATLSEVKDEHVAITLARKAGVLKLFRDEGAKKPHIETALRKLFPEVKWYS